MIQCSTQIIEHFKADPLPGRIGKVIALIERLGRGAGARCRSIRLRTLREAPYAFGTTVAETSTWPAARREAQVLDRAIFVAVVDGRDVGVAGGIAHERTDVRELVGMWVDPAARRRGIGVQLIDNVATWAKESGASVLVLDVVEENAPDRAIRTYWLCPIGRRGDGRASTGRAPLRTVSPMMSTEDFS
jgi:GNAT superfamily N-acetyltransferase